MRKFEDRPRYMCRWTLRELIDGMSRAPTPLTDNGFDRRCIQMELEKRGVKRSNRSEERRRTRFVRKANIEELRLRCGMLNREQWDDVLPKVAKGTAELLSGPYQSCMKSIQRVVDQTRAGVLVKGRTVNVEATWILGYWAFLLKHGGPQIADKGLNIVLAKIAAYREKRFEGKHYNIHPSTTVLGDH